LTSQEITAKKQRIHFGEWEVKWHSWVPCFDASEKHTVDGQHSAEFLKRKWMKVSYIPKSKMWASNNHNSLLNLDRKVKEKSEPCDLWTFASTLLALSQLTLRCPKYFYSLIFRYLLIILILNNFSLFLNVVKWIYYIYKKCANLKFYFLPIAKISQNLFGHGAQLFSLPFVVRPLKPPAKTLSKRIILFQKFRRCRCFHMFRN